MHEGKIFRWSSWQTHEGVLALITNNFTLMLMHALFSNLQSTRDPGPLSSKEPFRVSNTSAMTLSDHHTCCHYAGSSRNYVQSKLDVCYMIELSL